MLRGLGSLYTVSLLAALWLVAPGEALAQQPRLHRFLIDYTAVEHNMKHDQGYSLELLEIYKQAPGQLELIGKYWQKRGLEENRAGGNNKEPGNKRKPNKLKEANNNKKRNDKAVELNKNHKLDEKTVALLRTYYLNHWNEINNMIAAEYRKTFPDKPLRKLNQ